MKNTTSTKNNGSKKKKLKVYIAAPWDDRLKAKRVAKRFEEAGMEISHEWWKFDKGSHIDEDPDYHRKCAEDDLYAVMNCDVFYLLNLQKRGEETSGKAVELGIALGHNQICPHKIMIFAEGIENTNVFHLLRDIKWVKGPGEVIKLLGV